MCDAYGEELSFKYCNNQNSRAPLTIRVNPLRISREDLMKRFQEIDKIECFPTEFSPYGIKFNEKLSVRNRHFFTKFIPELKTSLKKNNFPEEKELTHIHIPGFRFFGLEEYVRSSV